MLKSLIGLREKIRQARIRDTSQSNVITFGLSVDEAVNLLNKAKAGGKQEEFGYNKSLYHQMPTNALHTLPTTIGLWHFDAGSGTSAVDSSTHSNNLSLSNCTWSAPGYFGDYCLYFNGTTSTASDTISTRLPLNYYAFVSAFGSGFGTFFDWPNNIVLEDRSDDNFYATIGGDEVSIPFLDNVLYFDGNTDYITLGTAGQISELSSTTTFTICAWVRFDDITRLGSTLFRYYVDANNRVELVMSSSTAGRFVAIVSNGSSTNGYLDNLNSYISNNELAHIAVVYNGAGATNADKLKLYINGTYVAFTGFTGTIPATTANLSSAIAYISMNNTTLAWKGRIQDFRIYSTALSDSNILSVMKDSSYTTNMVHRYALNEGTGTTATDSGSNAINGTISNATWMKGKQVGWHYYAAQFIKGIIYLQIDDIIRKVSSLYIPYSANSDIVECACYDSISTGAANWGGGNTERHVLNNYQKSRIRQNGTITRISLYLASKPAQITAFYFEVWRKNGTTWDRISQEDIWSSLSAATVNVIDLNTPVEVEEGDYIGYGWTSSSAPGYFMTAIAGGSNSSYYITDTNYNVCDYAWNTKTSNTNYVPIKVYMQSPMMTCIGDSIIAGHPAHYSFIESTSTTDIDSTIIYNLCNKLNYTYQNMGIGSQTTTLIANRFTSDVVNLKPQIALINGGVNDIALGTITKTEFLANWTTILDACKSNNIVAVVLKILPWTDGTNVQMQTRDEWNADLATLVQGYDNAIIVDASEYVGQFRVGGDPGNLWDIQPIYDADGVHYNADGYVKIAEAIFDAIMNRTTMSSDSYAIEVGNTWNGFLDEVCFDANIIIEEDWPIYPSSGLPNDVFRFIFAEGSGPYIHGIKPGMPTMTIENRTWGTGYRGHAIVFDGSTTYGTFTCPSFTSDQICVEFIIKFAAVTAQQILAQTSGMNISYNGSAILASFNGASDTTTAFANWTPTLDTWYQISISYDGSYRYLWINGNLYSKIASTGTISIPNSTIYVGRTVAGSSYLNATLDSLSCNRFKLKPYVRAFPRMVVGMQGFDGLTEWVL